VAADSEFWQGSREVRFGKRWKGPAPHLKSCFNRSNIAEIFLISHPIKIVSEKLLAT